MKRPVKKPAKVGASHITSHSYDPGTERLTITFYGDRAYHYYGVPKDLAEDFAGATSKGSFLHKHIIGKHRAVLIKP